jgi:hypothetical protein
MKKILFVVVLIFCLLGTTQTAYSYFDNEQVSILNEEGELYKITKSTSSQDRNLIPLGAVLGINDTYSYIYHYEVYVEKGMELQNTIDHLSLENSVLTDKELNEVFDFSITVDHVKDVELSNGLFEGKTAGELIHITIEITMNSVQEITLLSTNLGHDLSFTYLLTLSKIQN